MRVADYIADFIYKQEVKDIFILSGGGSIYLDDGIACHKYLNEISVRHEATAPMMAGAYSKITGNIGVVYVTSGPGGANAVSGLAETWVDSSPVLIISGQLPRNQTTYNSNIKNLRTLGIQELNIIEIVKPITKYAIMINDPNKIKYHLEKAVYLAIEGRPGPVWLDIPLDVQSAIIDENNLEGYSPLTEVNNNMKIDRIISLFKQSKKPLIIAGQGIKNAKIIDEFCDLLKYFNVPVIFSRLGQDILPFSHSNNFGHGGIKGSKITKLIMEESDLIISLGSRMAIPFAGDKLSHFSPDVKIIMVDVDMAEILRISPYLYVNVDLKLFISRLLKNIKTNINIIFPTSHKKWLEKCQDYKRKYDIKISDYERNPIDLYYFINRIDVLSENKHIIVDDAGSTYYVGGQILKFEKGQREITSGAFASMGLSIPLAIGCAVADKNVQILAITGDGSLELNIQELKTMSFYNLNIKLFVINNGGYVSIRNTQDQLFNGRYINSDQVGTNELLDFSKIADAFDLPYFNIQKYEEVDSKILNIINEDGPAFIEVVCDNNQKIIEPYNKLINELS